MTDYYPSRTNEEHIIDRIDPTTYGNEKIGEYSCNQEEINSYDENGYIKFDELFSLEEINQFKEEIHKLSQNPSFKDKEEFIFEPTNNELRTIFSQHIFSKLFDKVSKDRRILDKVNQILNSDVYIHQSRINIKPAYNGKAFDWHSDFETWHSEDGLARCRCLSAWIMLDDNTEFNGPLFVITGSHKKYISCKGYTPVDNYKNSLKKQEFGVPSLDSIKEITKECELVSIKGKAGTLVLHDGNILHGSSDNISPYSRTNMFFVFNSVENLPKKPFAAPQKRANFLALNDFKPIK